MEETDMCIQPIISVAGRQQQVVGRCTAQRLTGDQRQELAIQALAGAQSISQLAREHEVSRKFVYQQTATAQQVLDEAFAPDQAADKDVLFYLPVTKAWLRQLVLGLVLICHSSLRSVVELLRDLFDYSISVGTVHNILQAAVPSACRHNSAADLSAVRIGAHDEIFQTGQPVLVGADVASTFCYLLSLEEHRDAETWGIRLLELRDRGFQPDATIADFGSGLRAGQQLALPETPCWGDVFHALQELTAALTAVENRAYQAMDACHDLERKQARYERRHGRLDLKLLGKLTHAKRGEAQAIALAEDVAVLVRWLRQDVLAVAGPTVAERRLLYDFVVSELRMRAAAGPWALGVACRLLENHPDEILAFALPLDEALTGLAEEFQVPVTWVRELLYVQAMDARNTQRWQRDAVLRQQLRGRYHPLSTALAEVARQTVRASSVIENLNSRLRNYFFLRRHLGPDYLALLQFYLNHRRFLRSEHPERVGKSPAELLAGQPYPHWLELLGHTRFSRN
jgi:hypothetical protein